jgi:uncharacterized protein
MNSNEELVSDIAANATALAWPVLSPVEIRVLGCLVEKAVTTPDIYPLTLNALTHACNQKSNRDPVMSLDEADVVAALDALRHTYRLAALVHTAGSRVEKFKHAVSQVIALNPEQAAILCELLLRGPETVGELRTRATRLHPFHDLDHVQHVLDELAGHAGGPLVVKLPREPGRREPRWMHLLAGPIDAAGLPAEHAPRHAAQRAPQTAESSELNETVRALREELAALKAEFAEFRRQFD